MKNYLLILMIIMTLLPQVRGQHGQWLPAGIDLHQHGTNHFDGNWQLVFDDEFNYLGRPNSLNWVIKDGSADGWAVSTFKYNNVYVDGAYCHIMIVKEDAISTPNKEITDGHFGYTSGNIETTNWTDMRHEFENGMFEARIKMSGAYWSHNNFWLYSGHGTDGINIDECKGSHKHEVPEGVWNLDECVNTPSFGFRVNEGFHIYTCIWDKYFLYFYVDHSLRTRISKFNFFASNDDSYGYSNYNSFDIYTTRAGYYWAKACFYPINTAPYVIVHLFLDSWVHDGTWWQRLWHKQDQNLASDMQIDWVRVYQRGVCDEDETITNPVLLPYNHLEDRNITMGTQDHTSWTNIVPYWYENKYEAQSITLLPNFDCSSVIETHPDGSYWWTHTIFNARPCPFQDNEYIHPPELGSAIIGGTSDTDTIDSIEYNCENIDTTYLSYVLDSLTEVGDTTNLNLINHILDSLGCWSGGSKPSKAAYRELSANVYPNPNEGNFTVRVSSLGDYEISVTDMIGRCIYKAQMKKEDGFQKKVTLVNALSGTYIVEVSSNGVVYRKHISVVK